MRTDAELIARYGRTADREALGELFARHYPAVYQVVLRLVGNAFDARDVTQAVFLSAIGALGRYEERGRFRQWLLAIAVNEVREHRRRRARHGPPPDPLFDAFDRLRLESGAERADRREFEQELDRALGRLPERLRTPLVLHYYQDLSYAEAARILGLPKSTVQARLERAVGRLRATFRGRATLLPLLDRFLPCSGAAGSTTSLTTGILAMTKTKIAAVAVLVALVATGVMVLLEDGEGNAEDASRLPSGGTPGIAAEPAEGPSADPAGVEIHPFVAADGPRGDAGPRGDSVLTGVVLGLEDRRPVAGADVTVGALVDAEAGSTRPPARLLRSARTDAGGRFALGDLPGGVACEIRVRHPDYAYGTYRGVRVPVGRKRRDLGVLLLETPRSLVGRVVDPSGDPVAGAVVTAGDGRPHVALFAGAVPRSALAGARAVSGRDGSFRLDGLAPGFHRVQARKEGHSPALAGPVRVPPHRAPAPTASAGDRAGPCAAASST